MHTKHARRAVIIATLVAGTSSGAALAATSDSGAAPRHTTPTSGFSSPAFTPDDCIRRNGGDYNACNVGNSGRGDLPYQSVPTAWLNPALLHQRVR
jgi:hypothetical protein